MVKSVKSFYGFVHRNKGTVIFAVFTEEGFIGFIVESIEGESVQGLFLSEICG